MSKNNRQAQRQGINNFKNKGKPILTTQTSGAKDKISFNKKCIFSLKEETICKKITE